MAGGTALCCGAFGAGTGAMLLDEVTCRGNETQLEQCGHNGWGQHDCEPAEAVGVRCSGALGAPPPPRAPDTSTPGASAPPPSVVYQDGDVRLVDGYSDVEGRLEVFYQGEFGSVCDDRFDHLAAQVVCRQLGLSGGSVTPCCGVYPNFGAAPGVILLDEVSCLGNETRLEQCGHRPWGQNDCEPEEAVGVICSGPLGSAPAPSTAPDGGGSPDEGSTRDLSVPPPVECIFLPSDVYSSAEGVTCTNPYAMDYYGTPGTFTSATYRVVYVYADGSHSCPSPINVTINATAGGPAILVRLSAEEQGSSTAAAQALQRSVMIQRKGLTSTVQGSGPDWLSDLWMDVWSQPDVSLEVYTADWFQFYNAKEGTLTPAGPQVVGWRWKYGSSGVTDGYLPVVHPELTANATGGGISTTYQLVYHLDYDFYSFPSPDRFEVFHASASTPLLLYVQLESSVHPANMVALLLQRVEDDSVWTVARITADAPEIVSGQQGLFFTDVTSGPTWGCQSTTALMPSVPPSTDGYQPVDDSMYVVPSPLPALDYPVPPSQAVSGVTCRLVLVNATITTPLGNSTDSAALAFRRASLDCWDSRGREGDLPATPVLVEVGPSLAQHLSYTGIQIAQFGGPTGVAGSPNDTLDGLPSHWGIAFTGINLTLVDSNVMNVPLSPYGPLVECRGCTEVTFANVTFRDLGPPLTSDGTAATAAAAAARDVPYNLHGAVAASGILQAGFADFTCTGVTGASGWACLLLEYQVLPGEGRIDMPMTRCAVENNTVVPAAAAAGGAVTTSAMQRVLQRANVTGAGAVVLLSSDSRSTAPSTAALTVRITDSKLAGNSGGSGAALFSNMPMEALAVRNSSVINNRATRCGGAVYLDASVALLAVQQGSMVDNNTVTKATDRGLGGAFFVAGSVGSFTVEGRSSVSGNSASTGGGALCAELTVESIAILGGSSADRNRVAGDDDTNWGSGGFVLSDSAVRHVSNGTSILVSDGSSVSGNFARYGGVIWLHWLKSFVVSNHSRVDGNKATYYAGVVQVERLYSFSADRSIDMLLITGYSSMSNNTAAGNGVMLLPDLVLRSFRVTNSSRFDGNRADGSPAGIQCQQIDEITISGNSSMSYNEAARELYGGGVIAATSVGTFLVTNNSRVSNNYREKGTGAILKAATMHALIIRGSGSAAENNIARDGDGGLVAITNSLSVLEISGGARVTGNGAPNGKGGLLAVGTSIDSILIDGAVLANNSAYVEGGAVYVGQDVTGNIVLANGALVEGNRASTYNGGFLSVGRTVRGSVQIANGSRLCSCYAGLSGGAIYVHESIFYDVEIANNATVCSNQALTGDGGAVRVGFRTDRLELSGGSRLEGNAAGGSGGAMYVGGLLASATLNNSRMADNNAGADGGALYAAVINTLVSSGSAAVQNVAGGDGGFASASRITSIQLSASQVARNWAGRSGGVASVLTPPDSVAVVASNLTGNIADRGAGGVINVVVPQPGSPLLTQVATETGQISYSITDGSVVMGNGAYLDGGAFSVAAEVASDPTAAKANVPQIALTVDISGASFYSNYAGGAGGALSVASPSAGILSASVSVFNSTFSGNTAGTDVFRLGSSQASGWGGAISVMSTPKFRAAAVMAAAREAVSSQSTAQDRDEWTPSVSLDSACKLHLEAVTFTNNRCEGSGGAVVAVSCPTLVSGCTFSGNAARFSGGGVAGMVEAVSLTDIAGAQNGSEAGGGLRRRMLQQALNSDVYSDGAAAAAAAASSGGVQPQSWWLDVRNSTFDSNTVQLDCGGGVYTEVAQGIGSRVSASLFVNNVAVDFHGGGVCVASSHDGGQAVLSGGNRLINNSAARQGGGVYALLSSGTGNTLTLDTATLSGNLAIQGGALFVTAAPGSRVALSNVSAEGNRAYYDGGAAYAHCGAKNPSAEGCGSGPILTLRGCNLTANTADYGHGGGVYVGPGASVSVNGSALTGNTAGAAGGGVAAVGCTLLTVTGGSVARGSALLQGGGVFTRSCAKVLLQGLTLEANIAGTGGGAFIAGPSDDTVTVTPIEGAAPAQPPSVMLLGSTVSANLASKNVSGYQRYGGHGGGVFAFGNVSVFISDSNLRTNNSALVGAALASSQECAAPDAGRAALGALGGIASGGAASVDSRWQWAALAGATAAPGGCWPLLLWQVQLPSKKALPVWMQDPSASALQARCGEQQGSTAANASALAPEADCADADPGLLRTCSLLKMLAACTPDDDAGETQLAQPQAGRLDGALLDVAPTHMLPESFPGQLRPGTPVSISVRLYNGLEQPVQEDTLALTVTISIEPADRPATGQSAASGGATSAGDSSHLRANAQHPWQDASIAYLDPGSAAGGSLAVPVRDGLATWPYLTARGWPGRYTLVLRANSSDDGSLYQIAPLRLEVDMLGCQAGEALDLTWTQQPGAQPSWLACSRCGRGRFTLWRDQRPALWDINASDYKQFMKDVASGAAEGEASCLPCPSRATCLGGAVLLPDTGYWHSAPDSALFHRCPKEQACGKGVGDGVWASMPSVSPGELQVGMEPSGALVLMNTTSNATLSYDNATAAAVAVAALQGSVSTAPDTRAGWLALCQQLGYQAMAGGDAANSSTGSSISNTAAGASTSALPAAGGAIGSLAELVSACTAWGAGLPGGSDPYLQLECATGYAGRLCAACTSGYFVDSEFECKPCPKLAVNVTLAILAFLGGVALVLYTSLTNLKENYGVESSNTISSGGAAETSSPDFLKVAIVHAQYYIIITRLPVNYPDVITRLQAVVGAVTGAESTIAFSYGCLRPGLGSGGQAEAQLLGALLVPCVIILTSLGLWLLRYMFLNRAKLRRMDNLRVPDGPRLRVRPGLRKAELEAAAAAAVAAAAAGGAGAADDDGGIFGEPGFAPSPFPPPDLDSPKGCPRPGGRGSNPGRLSTDSPSSVASMARSPLAERLRSSFAARFHSQSFLGGERARAAMARMRRTISQSKVGKVLERLDETLGIVQQLSIVHMVAIFILYPGWAQAALSVFACYRVDDGTSGFFPDRQQATWRYGYWIRDMTQECYSGIHRRLYLPMGIVAVILVCLGPPLTSFATLWYHRKRLDRPSVQQRYGFLYSRYKPRYFWWESVLMLEELAMVAVEVFGRALPVVSHQILLMLAAFIVISLINMTCAPVRSRTILVLEFLSMGVLSLTVTLSLYFVVNDNLSTHAMFAVGLLILVINVALLAAFLMLVLRRNWGAVSERSAKLAHGLRRHVLSWQRSRGRDAAAAAALSTIPEADSALGDSAAAGAQSPRGAHGPASRPKPRTSADSPGSSSPIRAHAVPADTRHEAGGSHHVFEEASAGASPRSAEVGILIT